jgi:hypothetical protein
VVQAAGALDPDVVRAVDHHLGDRLVGQRTLEWAVAEDVVGDLVGEPLAVVARDPGFAAEVCADVGQHALALIVRVEVGVEEPRPELADDGQVHPVLELGERIALRLWLGGAACAEALVEVHHEAFLRNACRRPLDAGAVLFPELRGS